MLTFTHGVGAGQSITDENARIGIGTDEPEAKLHVEGSMVVKSTVNGPNRTTLVASNSAGVTPSELDTVLGLSTNISPTLSLAFTSIVWSTDLGRYVAAASDTDKIYTSENGIAWTERSLPQTRTWNSVARASSIGRFVVVADRTTDDRNVIATSENGATWTGRNSGFENNWRAVAFGNGIFVAISFTSVSGLSGSRVMTSPDGLNWTMRTTPADNEWNCIAFGNGVFVALCRASARESGVDQVIMTSPNGTTWTLRNGTAEMRQREWSDITFGNGRFIAVAEPTDRPLITTLLAAASTDGISWTNKTTPTSNFVIYFWRSIAYRLDGTTHRWVAVGSTFPTSSLVTQASVTMLSTNNGDSWTPVGQVGAPLDWASVTASSTNFVAISPDGSGATNSNNRIMTSTDGSSWTLVDPGSGKYLSWRSITWVQQFNNGNGMLIAVASTGPFGRIMYTNTSSGSTGWELVIAGSLNAWRGIVSGGGRAVAVASSGVDRVITSTNGTTWSKPSLMGHKGNWKSIAWSPDVSRFVVVGHNSDDVLTSNDGITWTRNTAHNRSWNSVIWAPPSSGVHNGLFVAVASSGSSNERIMTSPNGLTWTIRTSPSEVAWQSVTWSPELKLFLAVANSGTNRIMRSTDGGVTWTGGSAASSNDSATASQSWRTVKWIPELGYFVALSTSGTNRMIVSPDGVNWVARTGVPALDWTSLDYSPDIGRFVSVANGGSGSRIAYSGLFDPILAVVEGSLDVKNKVKENGFNLIPRGIIVAWTGTQAPDGWALCNGESGTPDLQGRFILGVGSGNGLTNRNLNETGGAETHALTIEEMPSHNHSHNIFRSGDDDCGASNVFDCGTGGGLSGVVLGNTGGQADGSTRPHNNMPPFYVLAYIMKL
jgi:microcystin-dependent protein